MEGTFKKHKKIKIAVIVTALLIFIIYLLFFANLQGYDVSETQISKETALRECPEIEITDYDREFLNKILEYKGFEEPQESDKHASIYVTADEAGFERYALRPDENYTVQVHHNFGGMSSLWVSIQFEFEGGLYCKKLYLSADKTDSGTNYTKAVIVRRFDGKFIKQYWNRDNNERNTKKTYLYGIVGLIRAIGSAWSGI